MLGFVPQLQIEQLFAKPMPKPYSYNLRKMTMDEPEDRIPETTEIESLALDPTFKMQVERLYRLMVYWRWLIVGILWVSVGSVSLWGLRYPISLLRDYFTWTAVRYGFYYHPLPTLGLFTCIGVTTAVLFWQSRNIILGIPPDEQRRLEQQVCRIRQQGSSHPLWKWVCH